MIFSFGLKKYVLLNHAFHRFKNGNVVHVLEQNFTLCAPKKFTNSTSPIAESRGAEQGNTAAIMCSSIAGGQARIKQICSNERENLARPRGHPCSSQSSAGSSASPGHHTGLAFHLNTHRLSHVLWFCSFVPYCAIKEISSVIFHASGQLKKNQIPFDL